MKDVINIIWENIIFVLDSIGVSLQHNWKILTFAILLAVILKTYVNADKLSKLLFKRKKVSILASVLFGAFTPLCACGTTAVIIGMLTTALPWGPIMAFLTSSPLMSPDGFVLISGTIGLRFAIALTIASVVIGIASGIITNIIEKKTHYLDNQSRFKEKEEPTGCACSAPVVATGCACGDTAVAKEKEAGSALHRFVIKFKLREFGIDLYRLGFKQILLFYVIFIGIGSLINHFIPQSIIEVLFGADSLFAVPLASLIGLPLYITTDSGVPIIQSMIASGATEGAMMAFIITGSATSAWVIAGLTTFMKKRAIALYVFYVLIGGILAGYLLDFVNMFI